MKTDLNARRGKLCIIVAPAIFNCEPDGFVKGNGTIHVFYIDGNVGLLDGHDQ
jgi:hypothetical protein